MPDTRQSGQGTTEKGSPRKQDEGTRRQTEQGGGSKPRPREQGDSGTGAGRDSTRRM
jgi:hypothetical protein